MSAVPSPEDPPPEDTIASFPDPHKRSVPASGCLYHIVLSCVPPPFFYVANNFAARAAHKLSGASLRIYLTMCFYVLFAIMCSCRFTSLLYSMCHHYICSGSSVFIMCHTILHVPSMLVACNKCLYNVLYIRVSHTSLYM